MKATQASIILAALAAGSVAAPVEQQLDKRQFNCNGPYILAARGSDPTVNDPDLLGPLSAVIDQIKSSIPSATGAGVAYPATVYDQGNPQTYHDSVAAGISTLKDDISGFVTQCGDDSKIVLLGYSQGAQVVSNVLAGSNAYGAPMDGTYNKNIAAVALFGDPGFVAGADGNAGTATTSGNFAGQSQEGDPTSLAPYHGRLKSWCTAGDAVCANGGDYNIHGQEVQMWGDQAAGFAVALLNM